MKKFFLATVIFAALGYMFAGCLKDKGFDNHTYGINDPDTQAPGVGFPFGAIFGNNFGLDVSTSPQNISNLVTVNLESGKAASSDVHVTLDTNTTVQITKYNAANGTSVIKLPNNLWTFNRSLVIPAGGRLAESPITVSSTTSLDPNTTYAIGVIIKAVDGGYKIADNLKEVLIIINVKNKYDGVYRLKAYTNLGGNTSAPFLVTAACSYDLELETIGPNTVRMSNQPLWRAGAFYDGFCNVNFDFSFNLATDKVSAVLPWASCASTPIAANFPATAVPAGAPPLGVPGYDSRYDVPSKTIFVAFNLNNNPAWLIVDTLIYCRPR